MSNKVLYVDPKQKNQIMKSLEFYGTRVLPQDLLKLAFLLNTWIKRRVQRQGLNAKLRKMSYKSKSYKRYRLKKKRQVGYKDLTFSNRMWSSLTAAHINPMAVRSFFGGKEEQDKASENDKRDHFFGISTIESTLVDKYLIKTFTKEQI